MHPSTLQLTYGTPLCYQCARRWFDEADTNHLANMGKYVSAMLAAGARLTFAMQPTPLWLAMVIVTSSVATVYQLYWDFVKDWGLLNPKSKNPWLRDELVLKNNSIYYVSIVSYQYCLFSIFRPHFLLSSIKLQRQFLRRMVFLGSEFRLETRLG